ncbi:MAG: phosphoglucomutase, alpha-D-glucose phosphate-specific, partial [Bifidobacteriaceae bacterium]|nr:phosphoglucomutase, alpha-D-glucose phosphate-specific [Bifidobacteriaceae bacterium]
MDSRAGTPAQPDDLIDLDALVAAYYDRQPDPHNPAEQVVFGTSGHRGSAFDGAFNQNHIIAITAAIIEYRKQQGIGGPLFIGRDTHGLSLPAWQTALEVLAAAEVTVQIDARDSFTPTPAISRAILVANGCDQPARRGSLPKPANQADGIVVTPSHNPPRDGGFKYNPP